MIICQLVDNHYTLRAGNPSQRQHLGGWYRSVLEYRPESVSATPSKKGDLKA